MTTLHAYLTEINKAVRNEDAKLLRRLFRLDSDAYYIAGQLGSRAVPVAEINRVVGIWGDIVASFIQALVYHNKGDWVAACKEFRERHGK
ncbi:PCI domain-containing protein, partial [Haematococcus lacustris]